MASQYIMSCSLAHSLSKSSLLSKVTAQGQGHLLWGLLPLEQATSYCVGNTQFQDGSTRFQLFSE